MLVLNDTKALFHCQQFLDSSCAEEVGMISISIFALVRARKNPTLFFSLIRAIKGACFCFWKFVCSSYAEEVRYVLKVDFYTTQSKIHETDQNEKSIKVCKPSSLIISLALCIGYNPEQLSVSLLPCRPFMQKLEMPPKKQNL